ncbi:DUF4012 domain-containing protein [Cryobacterium sp. Y29]|uniref:DUF4012 domain-containing protein n=1 Tax=Cryobacterium sp. Y29 TaxID=2048285 RepID=UPI001304BDAB|nr:DUF4012 domain-containing protein [Cryobacterium sp. Y29]
MSETTIGAQKSAKRPRPRFYRRWWFWTIIGVVVVVALASSWVGVRGWQAKTELEAAIPLAATIKSQALAGDTKAANASVTEMASHTARARELTGDPVWRAAEFVPFVGVNLAAVRTLAAVADDVITDAAMPLVEVVANLNPATLKSVDGGIDLEPLVSAGKIINGASTVLTAARDRINDIDTSVTMAPLTAAVIKFDTLLASLAPPLASASQALDVIPDALGASAPRDYVIVFQNSAEARALGGTSLSFVLLTIDNGSISLGKAVPAGFGNFAYYQESVIAMPDGVAELYGSEFGRAMSNVTVRPSFESAAKVTQEMWKRQFGTDIDGVISVDPVALSYLLRGVTPVTLSTGDVLTSESLVPLLLNEVYMRFWSGNTTADARADNAAQDVVYAEIVQKTFEQLMGGNSDPSMLLSAVSQAVDERRMLLWSPLDKEQALFMSLGLDGPLPQSDETTDRVGVYLQENVGSKMNYYLQQSVGLGQAVCREDQKASYRISLELTNDLPLDAATSISPSILGTFVREDLKPGVQRMIVMVYAPPGSQIVGATIDGGAVELQQYHDTDYPVAKVVLTMKPGATSKLSVDVVAAGTAQKVLAAEVTPMVNPTAISDVPLDCASVSVK